MQICEYIYCDIDISDMRAGARFCSRKHKEYARYHREGDYYARKNRVYSGFVKQDVLEFCLWCGLPFDLDVHHLNGSKNRMKGTRKSNPSQDNDEGNLLVLCRGCHLGLHAMARRENKKVARGS